jgi:hypothetical protein
MPIDIKETGPIRIGNKKGNEVYIQRHVLRRWWDTVCDPEPIVHEIDHTPPDCSERKEWSCRRVRYEKYKIFVYQAEKKTSFLWYVGAIVVTIGLVAIGLGVVALIGLALEAGFAAGVSAAIVWSSIAAGGVTTVGGSAIVRLNADEWEYGDLISEEGPEIEEIDFQPMANRREIKVIQCPQSTGTGTGTGSSGPSENQPHEEGH